MTAIIFFGSWAVLLGLFLVVWHRWCVRMERMDADMAKALNAEAQSC